MWLLRKQMRKPFVTTRSRVYNKILQRNEHVCVCIRKRNFSTKTKGASSSTFLLPKLMNILCFSYCMCFAPHCLSIYSYNTDFVAFGHKNALVENSSIDLVTAICGTEGVLMHCLWANCFVLHSKHSKQS